MSHTDDGTLHAYLDGQLSALEAVELERHVAGCPECRARLDEERALVKRASRLLALAAPPERATPPWPVSAPTPGPAPARRRWWRLSSPLPWAALVALALGAAWYGVRLTRRATLAPNIALQRTRDGLAPAAGAPARPVHAAAPQAAPTVSGAPDTAARAAAPPPGGPVPVSPPTPGAPGPDVAVAREAPAAGKRAARPDLSGAWREIGFEVAGRLLGQPPAAIPGVPIRRLAVPRTGESVVAVEQLIDSATVVRLYERRREGAAPDTGSDRALAQATAGGMPRPARDVGGLHVEIEGSLASDSLTRLLRLVR